MKLPTGCLEEKLTVAGAELVAEELSIRRFETNLGDYLADRALAAFAKDGAQLAFVNAGTIRLNYNIAPGAVITRRNVEELFAYPAPLRLVAITGATLQKVVDRAISGWTGQGHFLQIAGFAYRHDPKSGKATDLTLLGPASRRVSPSEKLLAVVSTFLLDPAKGQDGYTMLSPADIVDTLGPDLGVGPDLKQIVVASFKQASDAGIAPAIDGRICNTERPGPCLVK
jgi:5'-nucleotidase